MFVCGVWFALGFFGSEVGKGLPSFEENLNPSMSCSSVQVQFNVIVGIPFQGFLFQR